MTMPSGAIAAVAAGGAAGRRGPGLSVGLFLSGTAHVAAIVALVIVGTQPEPARPPVYRVNLVGAPAGVRQSGVVDPKPSPPDATPEPVASGAERAAPVEKALPSSKRAAPILKATPTAAPSRAAGKKATATPSKAASPAKAGSGAVGGKGADVVNIRTDGIAFPYEGYLKNIVRQLTLSWSPRRVSAALITEVKFLIRRDGSVVDISVVKSSGDRLYDVEAVGAVEAVGVSHAFGALPAGWKDDVLVVYFTFDYSLRP